MDWKNTAKIVAEATNKTPLITGFKLAAVLKRKDPKSWQELNRHEETYVFHGYAMLKQVSLKYLSFLLEQKKENDSNHLMENLRTELNAEAFSLIF